MNQTAEVCSCLPTRRDLANERRGRSRLGQEQPLAILGAIDCVTAMSVAAICDETVQSWMSRIVSKGYCQIRS